MKRKSPQSDEYLQELGHRLRIIRTFLKLDQKEMSKLLKVGQSQMSKIESGRSAPTIQMLTRTKRLAEENDYLRENLSWEWIMDGKGKAIIG
jgi:transcriptional regulator with XRE-family HTH domain